MSDETLLFSIKAALRETRSALLHAHNAVLDTSSNIKTEADFLAQNTLLDSFKKNGVSCTFYSEELAEPIILGDGRYTISCDPVDNSYLFVKGLSMFSSIAMTVLEKDELQYAFVQSLGNDDLYYCDKSAAYLNDHQLFIQEREPVLIAAYAARFDKFNYLPLIAKLPQSYYYLNTGGPLLSAMVAANHFSATVEFKPTGFYEMAGAFIAQKAGAFVETMDGQPIQLDPMRKQAVIVANSEHLLHELQACFQD